MYILRNQVLSNYTETFQNENDRIQAVPFSLSRFLLISDNNHALYSDTQNRNFRPKHYVRVFYVTPNVHIPIINTSINKCTQ